MPFVNLIRPSARFISALAIVAATMLGLSSAGVADSLNFATGAKREVPPASVTPGIAPPTDGGPKRVQITGEIMDAWCQVTGIMGIGVGTGHHQCAIWCASGGGPLGIQGKDGVAYIVLKVEDRDPIADETSINIQTDEVKIDGDWYVRDDVNYLIVHKVLADNGVVNQNHQQWGIVPFGE